MAPNAEEQRKAALREEINMDEHMLSIDELYNRYEVHPTKGLSEERVAQMLEEYGKNELTPPLRKPWWVAYLEQYINFFALLLQGGAILCFIGYGLDEDKAADNLVLGCVLYAVVIMTATFSYMQEAKSAAIMEGFRSMIPKRALVIREKTGRTPVESSELVPGDLVEINAGDMVPADVRIVEASDVKVDNASLTGEPDSLPRGAALTARGHDNELVKDPMEADNLMYYTTLCVEGTCKAVVVRTGDRTLMGKIAGLTTETANDETPIAIEIGHFIHLISGVAIFLGVTFFIIGLILGTPVIKNVVFCIGIIVANVPEGLLATVTVSLALTAQRMYKKNVLVKNLESVETLGSTTVIASDKTGTLTQNRMTVMHAWYDGRVVSTPASQNTEELNKALEEAGSAAYNRADVTFVNLHRVAALCNNASFITSYYDENGKEQVRDMESARTNGELLQMPTAGDASESGLLKFAEPIYESVDSIRQQFPKVFEIKFNSTNKWQLSIHSGPTEPLLVMKGASDRLLDRCSSIMINGAEVPFTAELKQQYEDAVNEMGGLGERVLGFAYKKLVGMANDFAFSDKTDSGANFPVDGLCFAGLISMLDPPRDGVPEAVEMCKRASINVYMVTGDHPVTAHAIAKKVGIIDQAVEDAGRALVVKGDDIREWQKHVYPPGHEHAGMPNEEQVALWDDALDADQIVFARVSPQHKLLIVENCQRRKEIVAVTGDGVNDAPALKKADIGIAMGIAGKDVSKEAADMILMDDNFASIVKGVEEGRLIFDNLKKSIAYTLTSNIPEITPFLLFITARLPLPLSTVLILCVDLGTDMVPAIALAYESIESDIMDRPPRNAQTDRLVNRRMISFSYFQIGVFQALAGMFTYFMVMNDFGYVPSILPGVGLEWTDYPLRCKVDDSTAEQAIPEDCGYGWVCPGGRGKGVPEMGACKFPDGSYVGTKEPSSKAILITDVTQTGKEAPCKVECNAALATAGTYAACTRSSGYYGKCMVHEDYYWNGKSQKFPNLFSQKEALYFAQTAYFVSIVVVQWSGLLICKTRKLSLFTHGMKNGMLNFGLFFETALAAFLLYVPPINLMGTRPIHFVHWLIALPFSLMEVIYDEVRKDIIRRNPDGWVEKHSYW